MNSKLIGNVFMNRWKTVFIILSLTSITACNTEGDDDSSDSTGNSDITQVTTYTTYHYPVVDTDQSACYDASSEITCPASDESYYGQDAQHAGNASSYFIHSSDIVIDSVTGLMWQKSPDTNGDGSILSDDKLTYEDAINYCEALSLGGYSDWQLPDIQQLYSLIIFTGTDPSGYDGDDTSRLTPFIDTNYFEFAYGDTDAGERIIDAQYASSSLYVAGSDNKLFGVNFADGRIKGYDLVLNGRDKTFLVTCTRNTQATTDLTEFGEDVFLDNGNTTITDLVTNLMWTQDDSESGLNWAEALAWVADKNSNSYLGYSDWRLPNAKELQSILDYSRSPDTTGTAAIYPLFNATPIENEAGKVDYPYYWTSTTHLNWTDTPASAGVYVSFGRALGYIDNAWTDIHGAGAQRSDPKEGNPDDYPAGHGPQGDAIRIYNYVRMVRDVM